MTNYRHGKMIEIIGAMDSSVLGVHKDRCMLVRNRNANCLRCTQVCTTGAISLGDEGVLVDPDKCIGCGTCASACPTCCLEARNPSDAQLFARARQALAATGSVAFACENALAKTREKLGAQPDTAIGLADGTPIVDVVCLGRAEESLLVETAAHGARRISLFCDECESCDHASGGKLSEEICASAENLLAAVGCACTIERTPPAKAAAVACRPTAEAAGTAASPVADRPSAKTANAPGPDSAEPGQSGEETLEGAPASERGRRRGRIDPHVRTALRKGEGLDFVPEFVRVQADGTLPHFVPERRLRLFNSLKALGAPQTSTVETRLWGQVNINVDLCRSCRMCTVFCPTGAVARFNAANDAFGVEHRSALCVQCRMCEAICPEQAITVSDEVSLDEFMSGKKFRFEMKPIGWDPGAETSIASRMSRFIKTDAFQDPQAKMKPGEISKQRDYAHAREAKRREIREGE